MRNWNGTASFLHSWGGVMQEYPIAMFVYIIVVLPLSKRLKVAYPVFTQPWYADDAFTLGTFDDIRLCFSLLK